MWLAAKKYTLFAKDVDTIVCLKNYPFCACGCVASHVESEPPGTIIILYFESKIRCVKTDTKHEQSGQITWIRGGGVLSTKDPTEMCR